MAHRIATISMTLSDLQGIHLLQAFSNIWIGLQLHSSWQDFNWHSASRSPSVIAEVVVFGLYNFQQ